MEQAEKLLEEAIEWSPVGWQRPYPQRLYVIHDGWLYRAMPTNPGQSYHGFPEDKSRKVVPETLYPRIREMAQQKGCAERIEQWLL
jgi:hypothetical protein